MIREAIYLTLGAIVASQYATPVYTAKEPVSTVAVASPVAYPTPTQPVRSIAAASCRIINGVRVCDVPSIVMQRPNSTCTCIDCNCINCNCGRNTAQVGSTVRTGSVVQTFGGIPVSLNPGEYVLRVTDDSGRVLYQRAATYSTTYRGPVQRVFQAQPVRNTVRGVMRCVGNVCGIR